MKSIVLGANGFLGRNIVQKCLKKKWQVDCVYHLSKEHIPSSCRGISADELITCSDDYDIVFLTAAEIPYGNLDTPSQKLVDTNVKLLLRAADTFPNSRFVFASSVSVFGFPQSVITETAPFNRPDLYGLSKIAGEFIMKSVKKYSIIRFSSLYGQGMSANTFLPRIVKAAQETKKMTLYGDGSRQQDYLHISDAAELCMKASAREDNGVYLGVYGRSYANHQIAKIIQSYVPGLTLEFTGIDTSPSFIYDNEFTKKALDFAPSVSPEIGIKELLQQ